MRADDGSTATTRLSKATEVSLKRKATRASLNKRLRQRPLQAAATRNDMGEGHDTVKEDHAMMSQA